MHTRTNFLSQGIGFDTAFVVFLLAFEFGRVVVPVSIDGALMSSAIVISIIVPYFFAWTRTEMNLGQWLLVRSGVAVVGAVLGTAFAGAAVASSAGSVSVLPMLLLTFAVIVSIAINANSFLRLQTAK